MATLDTGYHDCVGCLFDVDCRDAHRFDSLLKKPLVASRVASRAITAIVGEAVDFNRQSCSAAIEIEDEWSDRMLAPKLEAIGLGAHRTP